MSQIKIQSKDGRTLTVDRDDETGETRVFDPEAKTVRYLSPSETTSWGFPKPGTERVNPKITTPSTQGIDLAKTGSNILTKMLAGGGGWGSAMGAGTALAEFGTDTEPNYGSGERAGDATSMLLNLFKGAVPGVQGASQMVDLYRKAAKSGMFARGALGAAEGALPNAMSEAVNATQGKGFDPRMPVLGGVLGATGGMASQKAKTSMEKTPFNLQQGAQEEVGRLSGMAPNVLRQANVNDDLSRAKEMAKNVLPAVEARVKLNKPERATQMNDWQTEAKGIQPLLDEAANKRLSHDAKVALAEKNLAKGEEAFNNELASRQATHQGMIEDYSSKIFNKENQLEEAKKTFQENGLRVDGEKTYQLNRELDALKQEAEKAKSRGAFELKQFQASRKHEEAIQGAELDSLTAQGKTLSKAEQDQSKRMSDVQGRVDQMKGDDKLWTDTYQATQNKYPHFKLDDMPPESRETLKKMTSTSPQLMADSLVGQQIKSPKAIEDGTFEDVKNLTKLLQGTDDKALEAFRTKGMQDILQHFTDESKKAGDYMGGLKRVGPQTVNAIFQDEGAYTNLASLGAAIDRSQKSLEGLGKPLPLIVMHSAYGTYFLLRNAFSDKESSDGEKAAALGTGALLFYMSAPRLMNTIVKSKNGFARRIADVAIHPEKSGTLMPTLAREFEAMSDNSKGIELPSQPQPTSP